MSKLYALGFFLIAGGAFGVIDFNQQAQNAGESMQTYSVSTYAQSRLGSVGGVFVDFWDAKQLKQRQQKAASIHLPEAPEGWTRRAWADSDRAVYLPYVDFSMTEELAQEKQAAPTMNYAQMHETVPARQIIADPRNENPDANFLEKSMRMPLDKMLHRDVFIYQRGEEIVALRATYDPRMDKPKSVIEWVMIAMSNEMKKAASALNGSAEDARAFGYYGGVPFERSDKINELEYVPTQIKVIEGRVSPSIKVEAWSMATDQGVHELLSGIDYSGLNAMLDEPVPGVKNSDTLPLDEQIATASAIFDERDKAQQAKAQQVYQQFAKASGAKGPMGMGMGGGLKGMMENTAAAAAVQQGMNAAQVMNTMVQDAPRPPQPEVEAKAVGVFGALMKEMGKGVPADLKTAPKPAGKPANAGSPENMPHFDGNNLSPMQKSHIESTRNTAGFFQDSGNQDAARIMELERGLPSGDCVHDHDANKVHCNKNAENYRKTRKPGDASNAAGKADVPQPLTFTPGKSLNKQDKLRLAFVLMGKGLTPEDVGIKFDGINATAAQEWQQMRDGKLPANHPGSKVRAKEVAENLAPGSCLETVKNKIFCGETAMDLRLADHLRDLKLVKDEQGASKDAGGVTVNRLGNANTRTAGKTGLNKNCETTGAFKRCTVGN